MKNFLRVMALCIDGAACGILLFIFLNSHPEFTGNLRIKYFELACCITSGIGILIQRVYERSLKK